MHQNITTISHILYTHIYKYMKHNKISTNIANFTTLKHSTYYTNTVYTELLYIQNITHTKETQKNIQQHVAFIAQILTIHNIYNMFGIALLYVYKIYQNTSIY